MSQHDEDDAHEILARQCRTDGSDEIARLRASLNQADRDYAMCHSLLDRAEAENAAVWDEIRQLRGIKHAWETMREALEDALGPDPEDVTGPFLADGIAALARQRDEARATLTKALEWRKALDELHVTNWVGVIDGLTPTEAVRKLLELALDQERDALRTQLDDAQQLTRDYMRRGDHAARGGVMSAPRHFSCEFCGDADVTLLHLHARCHPTAPLRATLEGDLLTLFCYLPDCGREVAAFRIRHDGRRDKVTP